MSTPSVRFHYIPFHSVSRRKNRRLLRSAQWDGLPCPTVSSGTQKPKGSVPVLLSTWCRTTGMRRKKEEDGTKSVTEREMIQASALRPQSSLLLLLLWPCWKHFFKIMCFCQVKLWFYRTNLKRLNQTVRSHNLSFANTVECRSPQVQLAEIHFHLRWRLLFNNTHLFVIVW